MTPHPVRLTPGVDLRVWLEQLPAAQTRAAFVVAGIGSLSRAAIRMANDDAPTLFVEPLEILTLCGSLSPDGAHLHISVSRASGEVLGGHVSVGCEVRTTAEVLLTTLPGYAFSRRPDPTTGYPELHIEER